MSEAASRVFGKCPSEEIGAYLDAELTTERAAELESHFAECSVCREELNAQKTFLLELNRSLEEGAAVELPKGFTRAIVTKAESGVTGLRTRSERVAAFGIIGFLLLLATIGFAGDWGRISSEAVRPFATIGALADAAGALLFNVTFAVGFIVKKVFSGAAGTVFLAIAMALIATGIFWLLKRRRPAGGRIG